MKRWWSLLSEAVRGSDRDYTTGPFIAMMLAFSTLAIFSGVIFRWGRWKPSTV